MPFASLGLSLPLQLAVADKLYKTPSVVQKQVIPLVLEGRDLLAGSQTGSGKTAGFSLPILQLLSEGNANTKATYRPVRALILTPTRELAAQVETNVRDYGSYLKLRSAAIFGGVSINPQISRLRQGVDILVATPGRLLDHVSQRTVDLSKVEVLVLDEADRMLDMGFIRDIRRIMALLPKERQNLLFSATFSEEIKELANTWMNDPVHIEATPRNTLATKIEHCAYRVDRERKRELLVALINANQWSQILVFTRTKHRANRLSEYLTANGINSSAIHGNKSQGARTKALAEFKAGKVRALVATDIAARGLDIEQLPCVVNFELPNVAEDYIHRIGRTGRAGMSGQAVSLVCIDENQLLRDIERVLKHSVPAEALEGFEPDPTIPAEPITRGRPQRGGGRSRSAQGKRPSGGGGGAKGKANSRQPAARPARRGVRKPQTSRQP